MKRWKTILYVVLVFLVISLVGLAWWQRGNLKAVKDAVSYTTEELEEKLAENQQTIQEAVTTSPEITVREVTEEERQAFRDGTMTQEELVERLLNPAGRQCTETQTPMHETSLPGPVEPLPLAEDTYQKELSAWIARVYVLREEYTLALDNMYADAKEEYKALPTEKRTKTNLAKMASGYISKASDLEKECDNKMDEIINAMEKLIKKNNGDMSLVDTVVYTYANEKSLKKSWYMSKMEQRNLI